MEPDTTPTPQQRAEAIQQKVTVGLQTLAGYGGALAAALAPLIAFLIDQPLPDDVSVALYLVSGALAGITGKNRSDQAKALNAPDGQ